jgi:hypothetical protein
MSLLTDLNAPQSVAQTPYVITGESAEIASGGIVGRGVNRKKGAEGGRFLIATSATGAMQAVPMRAVAQAIYSGVITREEIAELHASADADAEAQGE